MHERCTLANCDGTKLGHELARDFPKETAQFDEAMRTLATSKERIKITYCTICDAALDVHEQCPYVTEHPKAEEATE